MKLKKIKELYNYDKSNLKDYLDKFQYPYEILPFIKDIIINLGNSLDQDKYYKKDNNIWISNSAKIDDSVTILGPCIIGENVVLKHCAYIRENVIIGNDSSVGNSSEIKNSILLCHVTIPHFNYVGDSVLGNNVHLGAGAILSNLKSNKSNIVINGVDTKLRKVGSFIGDNVEIGCNAVLNPGTIVGKNSLIYPLTMVRGIISQNKIVKDKDTIVDIERNNKIYIDFDHTMYDTDKLFLDFKKKCLEYNIDEDTIQNAINDSTTKLFNYRKVLDKIYEKIPFDKKLYDDIQDILNKGNNYVFEDVYEALGILKEKGYYLIILTYGDKEFQLSKIDPINLSEYFDEIIVTEEDKGCLSLDYKNSIFMDDKPHEIESIYKKGPKDIIRINRDGSKYSKESTNINVIEYNNMLDYAKKIDKIK